MKGWSDRIERPPRGRTLTLLVAVLLTVSRLSHAGWFNPHMETFQSCTVEMAIPAEQLKRLTYSSTLYYIKNDPDSDSVDAQMMQALGMEGMISFLPLEYDNPEVADGVQIFFTGTVYKRKASIPEKFIGGGGDHYFYEVETSGRQYLLDDGAFEELPFEICAEAKKA